METQRRYSSRKFITAMVWSAIWTGILIGGVITEKIYETLMFIGVGGYLAADVAEKRLVPKSER